MRLSKTKDNAKENTVLVLSLLFLGGVFFFWMMSVSNTSTVTATVKDKTVKRVSRDSDTYLVFTDKGTFKISDTLVHGNFRSSDLYGELEEGKTYTFKVFGYRIPLFSMYQTIHEAAEVK